MFGPRAPALPDLPERAPHGAHPTHRYPDGVTARPAGDRAQGPGSGTETAGGPRGRRSDDGTETSERDTEYLVIRS